MTNLLDGICIGILLTFYLCTVIALRWTAKTTTVTQYDPPAGVSPALAAYLRDNGKHERAFAAAQDFVNYEVYLDTDFVICEDRA